MGPADVIYGLLTLAFGGGLAALIKSRADARSINEKRAPEIQSINVTNLRTTIDGQSKHIEGLQADNAALRLDNHSLRTDNDTLRTRLESGLNTIESMRSELDR